MPVTGTASCAARRSMRQGLVKGVPVTEHTKEPGAPHNILWFYETLWGCCGLGTVGPGRLMPSFFIR